MNEAQMAALGRIIYAIKANGFLASMIPPEAEAEVLKAATSGITREQAVKLRRALDTAAEREQVLNIASMLGISDADMVTVLQWLAVEVSRHLDSFTAPPAVDLDPDGWRVVPVWTAGKDRKGSGLLVDDDGDPLEVVYNDQSRTDAWFRGRGKEVHTRMETGNLFRAAGKIWLSSEKGLPKDEAGGKITRCCEVTSSGLRELGFDTHYCGCGLELDGRAWFIDCAKGGKPFLRRDDGQLGIELNAQGIAYDAVAFPDGSFVAAIVDGQQVGLAWSTGEYLKCDARGLGRRGSAVLCGIAGVIMEVLPRGKVQPTALTEKVASSIDAFYTTPGGTTFLSTSAPDCLFAWAPDAVKLDQIARHDDASDGGSVFRSIVAGLGNTVYWGRNNKSGGDRWSLFRVLPKE